LILITFFSFHAESSRTLEDTGCLLLFPKAEASASDDQDDSVKQEEEELGILDRLEQVTDALLSR
jgi:hypothetical protein